MTDRERFDELWTDYLEGELDASRRAELEALMAADEELLRSAAESYGTHRLLGLLAESSPAQHEGFVRGTMARLAAADERFVGDVMQQVRAPAASVGPSGLRWPLAIAVAAAVILAAALWWPTSEPESVRILELNGAIQWTGEGEPRHDEIAEGHRLRSGTLEVLSADSWAVLEFGDGSTVTASGPSMLTLAPGERRLVHLHRGSLSASVRPQAEDRPMVVHTPTAELEVLGTQFHVDVQPAATMLTVSEGLVRVKRLADGSVAEVPAEHRLVAEIEPRGDLQATPRPQPRVSWRADLAKDATHGEWVSDLEALAIELKTAVAAGEMSKAEGMKAYKAAAVLGEDTGRLRATPTLVKAAKSKKARGEKAKGEKARGEKSASYLVVLSASRRHTEPIALTAGARFRIEGRVHSPADVQFGVTTRDENGRHIAKAAVSKSVECSDPASTFEVVLPVVEFIGKNYYSTRKKSAKDASGARTSVVGQELADWWCYTKEDAGLEILVVELLADPSAESPR